MLTPDLIALAQCGATILLAARTAEGLAWAMSVAMPRAVAIRSSGATQAEATFMRNSSGP